MALIVCGTGFAAYGLLPKAIGGSRRAAGRGARNASPGLDPEHGLKCPRPITPLPRPKSAPKSTHTS